MKLSMKGTDFIGFVISKTMSVVPSRERWWRWQIAVERVALRRRRSVDGCLICSPLWVLRLLNTQCSILSARYRVLSARYWLPFFHIVLTQSLLLSRSLDFFSIWYIDALRQSPRATQEAVTFRRQAQNEQDLTSTASKRTDQHSNAPFSTTHTSTSLPIHHPNTTTTITATFRMTTTRNSMKTRYFMNRSYPLSYENSTPKGSKMFNSSKRKTWMHLTTWGPPDGKGGRC